MNPPATAAVAPAPFALSVAPLPYYWLRSELLAFYAELAEGPADTVLLGEVVCARRHQMKLEDWIALGRELHAAGKEVVLATQPLVESEADLRLLARQAEQREFMVEAGDASALYQLAGRAPFVLGPHINIYNRPALQEHAALGAVRWVAPVELSAAQIAQINPPQAPVCADQRPLATEAWAWGRLPLALSARCFTARHYRLHKDACGYRCIEHPDGLVLASTEGQPFLALNGTQTQSAAALCLLGQLDTLRAAGVSRLRLTPGAHGFHRVLALFDAVARHGRPADTALAELERLAPPGGLCDGYVRGAPGMARSET